jgi:hypothetical protein
VNLETVRIRKYSALRLGVIIRPLLRLRITEFLEFVHRPEFWIIRKHNVSETGYVSVFTWEEGIIYSVGSLRKSLGPVTEVTICKGPNRIGVSLPSPEDRNRYCSRNIVLPSYLEFRTVERVQESSDSEYRIPSPEPFRFSSFLQLMNTLCLRF